MKIDILDHFPIFHYFNEEIIPCKKGQEIIFKLKINDQSILDFGNILSNYKWRDIYSEINPDVAYNIFVREFSKACSAFSMKFRKRLKQNLSQYIIYSIEYNT